jgi:hypothetical protein
MSIETRLEFATEFRDRYKNDRDNLVQNCKNKKVDIDFLADSFSCWGDDNNWKPMIENASKNYSSAIDKEMKKYRG